MAKQQAGNAAKKLARLAAVQALYQIELTQRPAVEILKRFKSNPEELLQEIGEAAAKNTLPDFELMGQIVMGVNGDPATCDTMIGGAMDARFSPERLEILLRAILRSGAFELFHHVQTPTGIIVNDYIDIAHAYFNAKEPGLVNAVLDRLAKRLRG